MKIDKIINMDILVVGGSGAGSMAAVTAAEKGAKVLLAVKGKLGKSGNAIMAGAGFSMDGETAYYKYGIKEADPKSTKEDLFKEIVKQSFYLSDQNMVEQFVNDCGECCWKLKQWIEKAGHKVAFFGEEGYITSGKAVADGCRYGVSEAGSIDVIQDFMVADVLMEDGRAVGAVGIDIYSGEIIEIRSKSVILATGGYQPYSFKCTVSDMTGDGMAMAYRAGAKLADMEFLLYIPGVALSPSVYKGSIYPFLHSNMLMPIVKNGKGECILDNIPEELIKMSKESEMGKLIFTYYFGEEIAKGKGTPKGGVYFDYSNVPFETYEGFLKQVEPLMSMWYGKGFYQGNNLDTFVENIKKGIPWEVGLGCEYSMGGIEVDENMYTGVPGLYAAGETTSGVFGAMRVADGLIEMLVQGYRSALSACEYIQNANDSTMKNTNIDSIIKDILLPLERKEGISPIKIHRSIEKTADAGFNFRRNEEGLTKALDEVLKMQDHAINEMSTKSKNKVYNYEWLEAIQSRNLLTCVEAGVRAALMRKESRGTHIRDDYEFVDNDNWLLRIMSSKGEDGKMKMSTRKPKVTTMELIEGKNKNIPDYMISILK
ncbi:succinate dehydrogenase [Clostridium carboxidivorans P7]|uniref:Succinate dehydrogenase n=1 Tax=Clostridium carboxidivorans P7 TaxID=536227 RepID=C6Q192_9CLOT|nr:FAD-binding protein [Clostridium carboxidivorans]AKN30380.1 succinate dehydrogenase [Clostridium carboxidivorans P7]EET84730.1 Succinate dehydrogenase [Clostridium carboxidivorans P7]